MIREIEKSDIPECAAVIKDSFMTVAGAFGFTAENASGFTAFATNEEKILHWMNEQHRPMYGYFENDKLIGYYNLLVEENSECELGSLCVLPGYRHSGIGELLLNDAIAKAEKLGCRVMKLSIVEENTVLRQWYEAQGFRHTGTKKFDFFPFTCGYMEKKIRSLE